MGLLLPRIFYDCLQLPFGLSTAHLCPCKILFHLTALPIPTLKAFSFKLAVLFFFFFLSIKILTFKEDTLVLTGQISPAFTLALVPDSIPLKTCSSLAWPPSTRTSPQAAHLPCRLTAVCSPSCRGASLAACACRPGNSILLGVSSLLVRTPNTFLGNLPRFCQWRCSRNCICFVSGDAAGTKLNVFFPLLHTLFLGLVISAHNFTLPRFPRLGITQLSVFLRCLLFYKNSHFVSFCFQIPVMLSLSYISNQPSWFTFYLFIFWPRLHPCAHWNLWGTHQN